MKAAGNLTGITLHTILRPCAEVMSQNNLQPKIAWGISQTKDSNTAADLSVQTWMLIAEQTRSYPAELVTSGFLANLPSEFCALIGANGDFCPVL